MSRLTRGLKDILLKTKQSLRLYHVVEEYNKHFMCFSYSSYYGSPVRKMQ